MTTELSSDLTTGLLLGLRLDGLQSFQYSSGERAIRVLNLQAPGSSGWTLVGSIIQTSSSNFLQLRLDNSAGSTVLALHELSGTSTYLRTIRSSSNAQQVDVCLANSSGSCTASPLALTLPSSSSLLLLDGGVIGSSPATTVCESVQLAVKSLGS